MPRLELDFDAEEARSLRGALLAARATELGELQRRAFRHSYGKDADTARSGMAAEVEHHRERIEVLDRLIEALAAAD
jgi:hypothetical protein